MTVHIDLDFALIEATTPEGMKVEAQAWVDEYAKAPGVEASIVRSDGPAGGWPLVRLTAASVEALTPALVAYDAGNQGIDDLLEVVIKS